MVLLKFRKLFARYNSDKKSTFHYGSIKITELPRYAGAVNKSTFHYGSIKIYCMWRNNERINNLHSTMVLLKFKAF